MKKIVAFVLALVMVLGLASVAFAATETKVEVEKWDLAAGKVTLKVTTNDPKLEQIDVLAEDKDGHGIGATKSVTVAELNAAGDKIVFEGVTKDTVTVAYNVTSNGTAAGWKRFDVPHVDAEVILQVGKAVAEKRDTIEIRLNALDTPYLMTAENWAYILNNAGVVDAEGWWYGGFRYLDMNIKFYGADAQGNMVIYYIDAADIDYTWTKAIDFTMTNGLVGYAKMTEAEVYAAIRKLTGDATKNPYTFGWKTAQAVPEMTISVVIPQQWLNVYGAKDLTLWAYDMEKETKCEVCGKVIDPTQEKLAEDVADANLQTQRIVLETNTLYKTLVLSTVAVEAEAKAADANPNTGANDIVNVAIVLSVISLVAAGAFVFSKQR